MFKHVIAGLREVAYYVQGQTAPEKFAYLRTGAVQLLRSGSQRSRVGHALRQARLLRAQRCICLVTAPLREM